MDLKAMFGIERKKIPKPEDYRDTRTYDYDTEEGRIATAEWLFDQAKLERIRREDDWVKLNLYYNGAHDVAKELADACEDLPDVPVGIPDPFIMVESQITPDIPEPEFHGRDNDDDSYKAKRRQFAVKYVLERNRVSDMNTANERRLRKYGDAFWKAYWDEDMMCGQMQGDIHIKDIPVEDIYPDPTTKSLQDGEYVDYIYTIHKNKFWRMYADVLKKKEKTLDDILQSQYRSTYGILEQRVNTQNSRDDLIQVLEHWFKQPADGKDHKAGDIGCTIQAGGVEIKYIPCYWQNTAEQNALFPFVHYWCIHDETGFYNKSELEPIIGLVDAADRELAIGIMNDAMMANDIIIEEDGALMPGEEITNLPGSKIKVHQGKMGGVARLGGLQSGIRSADMVNWILNQIQRTNRNYDTNNGQETAKVTTASGLLQLRSDAQVQSELKKADRNKGFCRLYELIDWLCLEFYTDDRLLFLGAKNENEENETMLYTPEEFVIDKPAQVDIVTGEVIIPASRYYPRIDVSVTTGDGLSKNPASTVQVLDRIAAVNVTQDNYKLLEAELDYLDIPQKQMICEMWDKKFGSNVPPELIDALNQNPELLQAVMQVAQPQGSNTQGTPIGVGDMITDTTPDMSIQVPTY